MSRLDILNNSLIKKQAEFDAKLQAHIDCVKSANGQPLNDKRNGHKTLNKWDRQNDSLTNLKDSIERTKQAIDREETKQAIINSVQLPLAINSLMDSGKLIQWAKHPTYFFVNGVDKARIVLLDNGSIGHKYLSSIPSQEQYAIFRDVFNRLKANLKESA